MKTGMYDRSRELLVKAQKVTPLGSQTYSKSYRYIGGDHTPFFIDRGKGSHVWDVDDNEFIDFVLALGAVTVGYNNEEINEAIVRQLERGISYSQATRLEPELAEKIVQIVPCAEMVRFVKNGSDATSAAVRLARAATGKDVVLACGYHGMQDWYIGATMNQRGVPKCVCELTKFFSYNDIASLEVLFDRYKENVAAVILEPIQDTGPVNDFLHRVAEITHRRGAILVFDEVISGFRYRIGGAQEMFDVLPDMAAIGKGMANGMPLSAVVGKADLLKQIEKGVFVSTTFGGETLSLAAALKTIEIMQRPGSFDRIWSLSERLKRAMLDMVVAKGLARYVKWWGLAPHGGFDFVGTETLNAYDLQSVYQQELLSRGIFSDGINNFCLSHDPSDIDAQIRAVDLSLDSVMRAVEQGHVKGILRGQRINPIFERN